MKTLGVAVLCVLLLAVIAQAQTPGAIKVWPYPRQFSAGSDKVCVPPHSISFEITTPAEKLSAECNGILDRAISRYQKKFIFSEPPKKPITQNQIKSPQLPVLTMVQHIQVLVQPSDLKSCDAVNMDTMNERYTLTMKRNNQVVEVSIQSDTVWGSLRALETLSQRIVATLDKANDDSLLWSYCVEELPLTISDEPRFSWRGLLIDTARHYLPIGMIQRIIDAMESDKLNVLHLHLVDAQSFPVMIQELDNTVNSFSSEMKLSYTADQLKGLVDYARDRGIRVVPEIDMPGHAYSWRVFGSITAVCPQYMSNENNIPLNPILDLTYATITKVLNAAKQIFPDKYLHLGADELVKNCWLRDPLISAFLANNTLGIKDTNDLWGYFQQRMFNENVKNSDKIMVAWEELILNLNTTQYTADASKVVMQIWNDPKDMRKVVQQGFKALLSGGYYLDKQKPVETANYRWLWVDVWRDMYLVDPMAGLEDLPQAQQLVMGGEGAMWGEQVDQTNIIARIWPRASAVAERLWSPAFVNDTEKAQKRLIHHRCYDLVKRGLRAGPVRPDFCPFVYGIHNGEENPVGPVPDNGDNSIRLLVFMVVVLCMAVAALVVALIGVIVYLKRVQAQVNYSEVQ